MALENPRVYSWIPDRNWPSQPFVTGEGLGSRRDPTRHHLTAGDGHRIPFPHPILQSEQYWNSSGVRVALFVQSDNRPYHGVDYVMEIHITGDRRLLQRISSAVQEVSPGSPRLPYFGLIGGGVAQGVVAPFRPSDLGREGHWTSEVELENSTAVVRYDYLPA